MRDHSPKHLDPRAPLVLDTRDLPRRPGSMRAVVRVVTAPADLGLELIGVPEGADLSLDLRMESVTEGVLVSGDVSGPVEGECGVPWDELPAGHRHAALDPRWAALAQLAEETRTGPGTAPGGTSEKE
ncbi:MAG: hypothetical protein E6G35_10435 [Actinobacteria bacterium]|nr:MAG: hypothetical protein E6G35_10435 [Actinomycetota bacterium]